MTSILMLTLVFGSTLARGEERLKPWMDGQFGAPIKANATDCFATVYSYDEVGHVNGWDCAADNGGLAWIEVAKPERVNRDLLKTARKEVTIPGRVREPGKKSPDVETYQVGDPKKAEFAMIFVHGAGGDKRLASRDTNMGGNFNRLMNLVVRNGGVYYSPTVDFGDRGEGIQSIIENLKKDNPGIKVILSCGSAGAKTCNDVAHRADAAPHLAGLMITGGSGGLEGITESAAYKKKVPIIVSHGSRDGVDSPLESFKRMREQPGRENYPVWMQIYNDGGHGTPIRMIDWRASLNWIFAQSEKTKTDKPCPDPNPNVVSPQAKNLLANVKQVTTGNSDSISCEAFLKYPFIRSRTSNAGYSAKEKSSCVASKKEETPGEDLGIGSLK